MSAIPAEIRDYLDALTRRVQSAIGAELLGPRAHRKCRPDGIHAWVSDIDVLAVSAGRSMRAMRQRLTDPDRNPDR